MGMSHGDAELSQEFCFVRWCGEEGFDFPEAAFAQFEGGYDGGGVE